MRNVCLQLQWPGKRPKVFPKSSKPAKSCSKPAKTGRNWFQSLYCFHVLWALDPSMAWRATFTGDAQILIAPQSLFTGELHRASPCSPLKASFVHQQYWSTMKKLLSLFNIRKLLGSSTLPALLWTLPKGHWVNTFCPQVFIKHRFTSNKVNIAASKY